MRISIFGVSTSRSGTGSAIEIPKKVDCKNSILKEKTLNNQARDPDLNPDSHEMNANPQPVFNNSFDLKMSNAFLVKKDRGWNENKQGSTVCTSFYGMGRFLHLIDSDRAPILFTTLYTQQKYLHIISR